MGCIPVFGNVEKIDCDAAKEIDDVVEWLNNNFLDYKLLINSSGDVEAVLLLAEYGGPTTWLLVGEDCPELLEELAELLRPSP